MKQSYLLSFTCLPFFIVAIFFLTAACSSNGNNSRETGTDSQSGSQSKPSEVAIPENRVQVKTAPIAEFKEKTDNPFNDWYFWVRIYETPKTFSYIIKMQFEEIKGEDTLQIPDIGIGPKPVIQKGNDKYSCIIGFLDRMNKFRDYKMVYVKEGRQLKLTTLKHYSMVSK